MLYRQQHAIEFGSKRIAYCIVCGMPQYRQLLPGRCRNVGSHCNGQLSRLRLDGRIDGRRMSTGPDYKIAQRNGRQSGVKVTDDNLAVQVIARRFSGKRTLSL